MNKSSNNSLAPMPTREEMEFYIRKGRQLQSEATHAMAKSAFNYVKTAFSVFSIKAKQTKGKPVTSISGHHVHGN